MQLDILSPHYQVGNFTFYCRASGYLPGPALVVLMFCPLATSVRWFPQHRALIAGLTVAGMGIGAILMSNLAQFAFKVKLPILTGFAWVGLLYGTVIIIAGLLLRFPVNADSIVSEKKSQNVSISYDRRFIAMLIGMFSGTFAGLLVVGNLKTIGMNWLIGENIAIFAVSLFAIGNAAGRIIWGVIADRFNSFWAIIAALLFAGLALLILPCGSGNNMLFLSVIMAISLAFGGCFVLFAAHVDFVYGDSALPRVYPLIFLTYGFAALAGPAAGGWLYQNTGSYLTAVYLASAVAGSGALLFFLIHRLPVERK